MTSRRNSVVTTCLSLSFPWHCHLFSARKNLRDLNSYRF